MLVQSNVFAHAFSPYNAYTHCRYPIIFYRFRQLHRAM
uniref:Uncharacterized protein n=1 Tax=Arundo donax TaxID=35708 RepID=A0A0A9EUX0_ARUDO